MSRKILVAKKLSLSCILSLAIFLCSFSAYAVGPQGKVIHTWASIKANGEATSEALLAPETKDQETGDPAVLAMIHEINEQLAAKELNIAVEAIEFFTVGQARPDNRLHQRPSRWVPGDQRRDAQGDDITYLVDQSDGATFTGLINDDTEAAIDSAMNTWDTNMALNKVDIIKRDDLGDDPDIFDALLGFGGEGNPFLADIVHAGWSLPIFPPGLLAFTVTFIFLDDDENPTDINGDNYIDTSAKEIYYNNAQQWNIGFALPWVDVETVALHEIGHALELGHFGPPPTAVMNPVYTGIQQSLLPNDEGGAHAVWSSWPNP